MEIEIREAKEGDAAGIAEVHVQTWKTSYSGVVPDSYLDTLQVSDREALWQRIIKEARPETHLFVALHNGKIVGFSNGGPSRTPEYAAEIYAIYLLKAFQGQGVGKQLFQSSLGRLATAFPGQPVTLWVLEENPTLAFYQKAGGVVVAQKMEDIGGKSLRELQLVWR